MIKDTDSPKIWYFVLPFLKTSQISKQLTTQNRPERDVESENGPQILDMELFPIHGLILHSSGVAYGAYKQKIKKWWSRMSLGEPDSVVKVTAAVQPPKGSCLGK